MIFLYIFGAIIGLILLYILFLWICALCVDPTKQYTDHSPFYRAQLRIIVNLMMWLLRIRVHVSGAEKLPAHKHLVFVSNHVSNFDPILTWHIFRKWNLAYISKPSNFKIPVFGRFIHRCSFLPIDRENPRNAMNTILAAAELLRTDNFSIGVYPEGTRSKTGELLPFHNGVFKIAQKADADVVVLSLTGTSQIHKNYIRRRSHVYLDVLAVLPAEQIKSQRTEQIGNEVRRLLLEHQKERT